jgi:hypothetical protein
MIAVQNSLQTAMIAVQNSLSSPRSSPPIPSPPIPPHPTLPAAAALARQLRACRRRCDSARMRSSPPRPPPLSDSSLARGRSTSAASLPCRACAFPRPLRTPPRPSPACWFCRRSEQLESSSAHHGGAEESEMTACSK